MRRFAGCQRSRKLRQMTGDRDTLRTAVARMCQPVERVAGVVAIVSRRSRLTHRRIQVAMRRIGGEMRRILPEVFEIMDGGRHRDHRP